MQGLPACLENRDNIHYEKAGPAKMLLYLICALDDLAASLQDTKSAIDIGLNIDLCMRHHEFRRRRIDETDRN